MRLACLKEPGVQIEILAQKQYYVQAKKVTNICVYHRKDKHFIINHAHDNGQREQRNTANKRDNAYFIVVCFPDAHEIVHATDKDRKKPCHAHEHE
jgi:hypothetical protein